MKISCIILMIMFCLISIEGQNVNQQDMTNTDYDDIKHIQNKPGSRMRHRRQSYYHNYPDYMNLFHNIGVGDFLNDILFSVRDIATQMRHAASNRFYRGYNYYKPEYINNCQHSLKELLTLYRELASHIKYSPPTPPPPQVIYVQYPVPASCNHTLDKTPGNVNITERDPREDTRGIILRDTPKNIEIGDDGDGARPVSFKPVQPNRPHVKPPPFEHGSTQAGVPEAKKMPSNTAPFKRFWRRRRRPILVNNSN